MISGSPDISDLFFSDAIREGFVKPIRGRVYVDITIEYGDDIQFSYSETTRVWGYVTRVSEEGRVYVCWEDEPDQCIYSIRSHCYHRDRRIRYTQAWDARTVTDILWSREFNNINTSDVNWIKEGF